MRYRSEYPGKLIFPSGQELSRGDFGDADPANPGIAELVDAGHLVPDNPPPVAGKGKKE